MITGEKLAGSRSASSLRCRRHSENIHQRSSSWNGRERGDSETLLFTAIRAAGRNMFTLSGVEDERRCETGGFMQLDEESFPCIS